MSKYIDCTIRVASTNGLLQSVGSEYRLDGHAEDLLRQYRGLGSDPDASFKRACAAMAIEALNRESYKGRLRLTELGAFLETERSADVAGYFVDDGRNIVADTREKLRRNIIEDLARANSDFLMKWEEVMEEESEKNRKKMIVEKARGLIQKFMILHHPHAVAQALKQAGLQVETALDNLDAASVLEKGLSIKASHQGASCQIDLMPNGQVHIETDVKDASGKRDVNACGKLSQKITDLLKESLEIMGADFGHDVCMTTQRQGPLDSKATITKSSVVHSSTHTSSTNRKLRT